MHITDAGMSFIIPFVERGWNCALYNFTVLLLIQTDYKGLSPSVDREVGSFLKLCVWGALK
jgi:hypothetical protein